MFRLTNITYQLLFAFLIAAVASGTGVAPVKQARDTSLRFYSATAPGENIFRAKCAVCHGVDGAGRTPNGKKLRVPDLRSDRVQGHVDDELLDIVTNGKGDMPPFGKKYTAEKIQQVVAYVRTLNRKN